MFIDTMNSITRAPAERNVSGNGVRPTYVRSAGSKSNFGGGAFYKHLTPNGAKGQLCSVALLS
jgi:hypothetical protein